MNSFFRYKWLAFLEVSWRNVDIKMLDESMKAAEIVGVITAIEFS